VKKLQHKESVRPVITQEAGIRVRLQIRNKVLRFHKAAGRAEQNPGALRRFPSALVQAKMINNAALIRI
jgi:hypothetical protein